MYNPFWDIPSPATQFFGHVLTMFTCHEIHPQKNMWELLFFPQDVWLHMLFSLELLGGQCKYDHYGCIVSRYIKTILTHPHTPTHSVHPNWCQCLRQGGQRPYIAVINNEVGLTASRTQTISCSFLMKWVFQGATKRLPSTWKVDFRSAACASYLICKIV